MVECLLARGPGLTPSTTNKQNVRLRLPGEEGEYHSLGLWLCLRLCSSLISLSLSSGSPLLPRTGQLTSTVGYEAAQVCRWGLPGSAAGLGGGWVPPPLLLPGGRACWLPSLPSWGGPTPTPPALTHSCCPWGHPPPGTETQTQILHFSGAWLHRPTGSQQSSLLPSVAKDQAFCLGLGTSSQQTEV